MNTLGLGRPVYSFGLGVPGAILGAAWVEIVRFALYVRRLVAFGLER